MRRDTLELLRSELNAQITSGRIDISALRANTAAGSTQSLQSLLLKATDPFHAADIEEKQLKEKQARARLDLLAPKLIQYALCLDLLIRVSLHLLLVMFV